ncbi:MAG: hypothetical protein P1P90_01785 [Patescibacteria group bacterium]|nr:hypothetical protein [Patescibacteria group bacterium]
MNKNIVSFVSLSLMAVFLFGGCGQKQAQPQEQVVLEQTYNISREYVALRYETDNVLINAEEYKDYGTWDKAMSEIIKRWEQMEKDAQELEGMADEMSKAETSLKLIPTALAYDKQEISNVFDKAPAGKKIATLAKCLGVDAKRAYAILTQDQAQVEADAWNQAGDTFQKLESSAVVIKDGCKVAGFVGGVVLSGGTSAIAAGSTLTKAAVVISGADLTLEVTSDGASIALGNNNKISAIANEARKATEPIATILTITDIPNNLNKGIDKFNAVMVGLEQFRGAAQEGKVLTIALPTYTGEKETKPITLATLEPAEVEDWLKENGTAYKAETVAEVEQTLGINQKDVTDGSGEDDEEEESTGVNQPEETESSNSEQPQDSAESTNSAQTIAGSYSGSAILQHVEEDVESPDSLPVTLQLNENGTGTVNVNGFGGDAYYAGNKVNFSVTMKEDGAVVKCTFDGIVTRYGSQISISGNMSFSMMGVAFASYSWSAQK